MWRAVVVHDWGLFAVGLAVGFAFGLIVEAYIIEPLAVLLRRHDR